VSEGSGNERRKRRRMTLPKKKDDIEKIVEEVQSREIEEHHHHHHHHHHAESDELLAVLELLVDSLNANIEILNSRVQRNTYEIARIYKVLGHILAYLAGGENARKHLEEAMKLLSPAKEQKAEVVG